MRRSMWAETSEGVTGRRFQTLTLRVFEWPHNETAKKSWAFTVRRDGRAFRYFRLQSGFESQGQAQRIALALARRVVARDRRVGWIDQRSAAMV